MFRANKLIPFAWQCCIVMTRSDTWLIENQTMHAYGNICINEMTLHDTAPYQRTHSHTHANNLFNIKSIHLARIQNSWIKTCVRVWRDEEKKTYNKINQIDTRPTALNERRSCKKYIEIRDKTYFPFFFQCTNRVKVNSIFSRHNSPLSAPFFGSFHNDSFAEMNLFKSNDEIIFDVSVPIWILIRFTSQAFMYYFFYLIVPIWT